MSPQPSSPSRKAAELLARELRSRGFSPAAYRGMPGLDAQTAAAAACLCVMDTDPDDRAAAPKLLALAEALPRDFPQIDLSEAAWAQMRRICNSDSFDHSGKNLLLARKLREHGKSLPKGAEDTAAPWHPAIAEGAVRAFGANAPEFLRSLCFPEHLQHLSLTASADPLTSLSSTCCKLLLCGYPGLATNKGSPAFDNARNAFLRCFPLASWNALALWCQPDAPPGPRGPWAGICNWLACLQTDPQSAFSAERPDRSKRGNARMAFLQACLDSACLNESRSNPAGLDPAALSVARQAAAYAAFEGAKIPDNIQAQAPSVWACIEKGLLGSQSLAAKAGKPLSL